MANIKFYRGQKSEYDSFSKGFVPSVYRDITDEENLLEQVSKHINDIYDKYVDFFMQFYPIDIEKDSEEVITKKYIKRLGVMQHYGMETPLLDVTINKDVAEFFACDGDYGKDGIIFSFEENKMSGIDTKTVRARMDIIWKNKVNSSNALLSKIYCFDYAKLFSTGHDNIRIKRQKGFFVLHAYENNDNHYTPKYLEVGESELVAYKDKIIKLLKLAINNGYTREYFFPDSDDMIKLVVQYYKLRNKGFSGYESISKDDSWREIEESLIKELPGYVFVNTSYKDFHEYIKKKEAKQLYNSNKLNQIKEQMKEYIDNFNKEQ